MVGAVDIWPVARAGVPVLQLTDVDVFIERTQVLFGINWQVKAGEHWVLSGDNGSGKSTLLRLLYGEEFAALYPRLAQKHGLMLYPFFLEGVAGDPALNLADGLHPNPQGVRELVRRILPTVDRVLDSLP